MFRFPFVYRKRYDNLERRLNATKLKLRITENELKFCNQSRQRLLTNVATATESIASLQRQLTRAEESREFWRERAEKKHGKVDVLDVPAL